MPPTIEHLRQLQCHRLTLRSIRPARNPYLTLFFESQHSQVEQPLPDSQIGQNDPNIADFIGVPGLEVEASLVFEGTIHGELAHLGPRDLLLYLLQMVLVEIYNRKRCTSALAQHVLQVEQSDPLVEIGIEVGELQLEVVETQNEWFGLPGLVLLEIIGRYIAHCLLQTVDETFLEPTPQPKELLSNREGKLAGTILLIKNVYKILNAECIHSLLYLLKTRMMVDHNHQLMRLAYLCDIFSWDQHRIQNEQYFAGAGELERVVLACEDRVAAKRHPSFLMEEVLVYHCLLVFDILMYQFMRRVEQMGDIAGMILPKSQHRLFESIQLLFLYYSGEQIEDEAGVAAIKTISMIYNIHSMIIAII